MAPTAASQATATATATATPGPPPSDTGNYSAISVALILFVFLAVGSTVFCTRRRQPLNMLREYLQSDKPPGRRISGAQDILASIPIVHYHPGMRRKGSALKRPWRPTFSMPSFLSGRRTRAEQDMENCAVCTDTFTDGEQLRQLPCGHLFHPFCVDPWIRWFNPRCPLW